MEIQQWKMAVIGIIIVLLFITVVIYLVSLAVERKRHRNIDELLKSMDTPNGQCKIMITLNATDKEEAHYCINELANALIDKYGDDLVSVVMIGRK